MQIRQIFYSVMLGAMAVNAVEPAQKMARMSYANKPRTPIHTALENCNLEDAGKWVKLDIGVHARDSKGNTPLHILLKIYDSLKNNNEFLFFDLLQSLINKNVDLDAKNEDAETPLHIAARLSNELPIGELIKHGADLEVENVGVGDQVYFHQTPLYIAVSQGNFQIVLALLQAGASPNHVCSYDDFETDLVVPELPLHAAIRYEYPNLINMLLQYDTDPNIDAVRPGDSFLQEKPPLWHLITSQESCDDSKFRKEDTMEMLLNFNAHPSGTSHISHLAHCIRNIRHDEVLRIASMLLQFGADPNKNDHELHVPLFMVAYEMQKKLNKRYKNTQRIKTLSTLFELLIRCGAHTYAAYDSCDEGKKYTYKKQDNNRYSVKELLKGLESSLQEHLGEKSPLVLIDWADYIRGGHWKQLYKSIDAAQDKEWAVYQAACMSMGSQAYDMAYSIIEYVADVLEENSFRELCKDLLREALIRKSLQPHEDAALERLLQGLEKNVCTNEFRNQMYSLVKRRKIFAPQIFNVICTKYGATNCFEGLDNITPYYTIQFIHNAQGLMKNDALEMLGCRIVNRVAKPIEVACADEQLCSTVTTHQSEHGNTFLHYLAYAPVHYEIAQRIARHILQHQYSCDPEHVKRGLPNYKGRTPKMIARAIGNTRFARMMACYEALLNNSTPINVIYAIWQYVHEPLQIDG